MQFVPYSVTQPPKLQITCVTKGGNAALIWEKNVCQTL